MYIPGQNCASSVVEEVEESSCNNVKTKVRGICIRSRYFYPDKKLWGAKQFICTRLLIDLPAKSSFVLWTLWKICMGEMRCDLEVVYHSNYEATAHAEYQIQVDVWIKQKNCNL